MASAFTGIDEWKSPSPFRKGESNLVDRSKTTTKNLTPIGRVDPNGFAELLGTDVDEEDVAGEPVGGKAASKATRGSTPSATNSGATVKPKTPKTVNKTVDPKTTTTSTPKGSVSASGWLSWPKLCWHNALCSVFICLIVVSAGGGAFAYFSHGSDSLLPSIAVPDATALPTERVRAETASAVLRPQYQPSPVEREWARLVAEVDPRECQHAWSNGSRLMARLERDVASSAVFEQSSSFTVGPESQGAALVWPIEPLVSFLRWPAALSPGHTTRAAIMNKSYYQLAPVRAGSRRFLFFDIGASLYSSARAGGDGGSSLRWFRNRYQNLTGSPHPFDHIYAWEGQEYNATVLWDSFPAQVVPFVSYYNVRADARPNAKHNPLRVLTQVARLDDHVVLKLDVDHQATQVALIQQVLGNRRISALIDELFWEHEVAGSAMGCPRLWKGRSGHGWSTMRFDTSQGRGGTLAESYELFGRLRSLGIAAHSWV
mmetsp:Transcript_28129/g.92209  ORF Transcript_28129/g.92209 Transcript_28129/m.92209 type:complete len:487 (+) Transcript_28129:32-1492(+)